VTLILSLTGVLNHAITKQTAVAISKNNKSAIQQTGLINEETNPAFTLHFCFAGL